MVVLEISLEASMNARIVGSGQETIILAHGYGTDQSIWDKLLPSLTQRYRVMVFDWKSSGASKDHNLFDPVKYLSYDPFATDLIALMEEMSLRSCVFIGHSMSAMIGCLASIKRSDLFKRLILIGASPRYLNTEGYEGGLEEPYIEQVFTDIETDFHTWASNFAAAAVDPKDPVSVEKLSTSLGRMRPEVALSLAKTIFRSDLRYCLDKVEVPCTIIQTSNDIVAPISVAYYMQKKIKGTSTVEIIEADSHFPQLTHSEHLLDVLERVLSIDFDKN